jgi:hypothetical protein
VVATRLMTHNRVMQVLCHSRSFCSGFLPPVLTQRPKFPKAEVPEQRIVVGLKWTRVSRMSSPGKHEGEMFEIIEVMKSRSERGPLI